MTSYVIIELDTTAPEIKIYAPKYTTSETVNIITIDSSEPLGNYQDIYVIDNLGNRYDYSFQRASDTKYIGNIKFNAINNGIIQIFARMKDEVENFSNIAVASIEIKSDLKTAYSNVRDYSKTNVKSRVISANVIARDISRKVVVETLQGD